MFYSFGRPLDQQAKNAKLQTFLESQESPPITECMPHHVHALIKINNENLYLNHLWFWPHFLIYMFRNSHIMIVDLFIIITDNKLFTVIYLSATRFPLINNDFRVASFITGSITYRT